MEFGILCTLLYIISSLQPPTDARVGKSTIKKPKNDSSQSEYDEYGDEYEYDYENGSEDNNSKLGINISNYASNSYKLLNRIPEIKK